MLVGEWLSKGYVLTQRVIEQKDRCKAGTSVPGNALFLVDVAYPEELFIADNN